MPSPFVRPFLAAAASAVLLLHAVAAQAQVKPALTRDVDRPEAQPVNGKCSGFPASGSATFKCILYTVPAGKRLVVELVSHRLTAFSGQIVSLVQFGRNDPGYFFFGDGDKVYSVNAGTTVTSAGFPTSFGSTSLRFYLEEGDQLGGSVVFSTAFGNSTVAQYFAFSGYLVDK